MNQGWEVILFLWIAAALITLVVLSVIKAYVTRERRWRNVSPHYGSRYDASIEAKPRPNIRLVSR